MTTTDPVVHDVDARRWRVLGYALLALLAYVPVLLTKPGKIVADTKSYLYLDPGRLLDRAASMWDPNIGMGTVTHQNIGYLFPMGPYYWLMHELGVPAWVSQRLWFGSLLLAAGVGVLFLMRTLRVRGPGAVVAAVLFMLSPYTLDFAARISVILMPWAGLPWMLALTIRALRARDSRAAWKYAAIFALVVQVVGGVNATALVFAGLAPVLWILYAIAIREVDWRRALGVTARIGVLTLVTSLWWIAGLWAQGKYGLNILKFTETLQVVSVSSTPLETLRGLGYWFFYGIDRIGHWTDASVPYMQDLWLLVVSFALPVLAFFGAACVRWRHRAYFVLLTVVGVVVAVGANPYDDPSPLGGTFKSFAESSSFGLALRSTSRAVPLVALGLAVLLGAAVNALARAWAGTGRTVRGVPVRTLLVAGFVIVLAIVNLPAIFTGDFYTQDLTRDETLPKYWTDAIAALDAQSHDTRVLEIPGADFAAYRWGQTVDPITPGLMDRPYVARELVPWGSAASADLLNALDRRIQEGTLDPDALAPIARLMASGAIVYRADLQTDRYNLVRSIPLWEFLTKPEPSGLGAVEKFGTSLGPPLHEQIDDERQLAQSPDATNPPPVSIFQVDDPRSIVRTADASAPLLVSGDGEALVSLASIGALSGDGVILYSASLDPSQVKAEAAEANSVLIVTDSNRKRARRWTGTRDDYGETERVDQSALVRDETDNRLELFPDAGTDAFTVMQTPGVAVSTSHYGDPGFYQPELRGARAFDGDVDTAWEVGAHTKVIGERLRLDLDQPITTDHVNLVQPQVGPNARYLTAVDLSFDGGAPVRVQLDDASRTPEGQTVTFPSRKFSRLEITLADTNVGDSAAQPTFNSVGFAEIRLRDDAPGSNHVRADEIVRMPTDLVDAAGTTVADRPLVYQMSRDRNVVVPPRYSENETALVRRFRVPDKRSFGLAGTGRLDPAAPDDVLDSLLGIRSAKTGGITVTSSEHLPADIAARGSSAFDDDPATAWSTAIGSPQGQWLDVVTPQPVTFDHLDLQVVADGKHSVPTQLQIDAGGESRTVDVPAITDGKVGDTPVAVPVSFSALTGSDVKITVTGVRPVETLSYPDKQPQVMPVAIAEVGMPGVQRAPMPEKLDTGCMVGLMSIDGQGLPGELSGSTADAVAGRVLDFQYCSIEFGGEVRPITLEQGDHVLRTTPGTQSGIDVDSLTLASDAGGVMMPLNEGGKLPASLLRSSSGPPAQPTVKVTSKGSTKIELQVTGARKGTPFWLVLGESNNAGWEAKVDGSNIGGSTLVDGYANGWRVQPPSGSFSVTLTWTPQQKVWIAIAVSVLALLVCLWLALRRRKAPVDDETDDDPDDVLPAIANPLVAVGERPRVLAVVGGAVAVGIVGALMSRWWVGLLAGALVALVTCVPRTRFLVSLGAPLALAAAALYVVVQQYRHDYVADLDWPGRFTSVNNLVWLAVVLLLADVVIERLRRRPARE